jgi:hypothetical protein
MSKNDQSNFYKYFLIIPIIMLFGALAQWPYGYFILLRWVVSIGAIIVVIYAFDKNIDWAKVVFIFIVILFNPIAPIYLTREIWIPIDIVIGIFFIIGIRIIYLKK